MLRIDLAAPEERGLRVLTLGAHPDDIEIGCGGAILHWAAGGRIASARWVVMSGSEERAREARDGADAFLSGIPDVHVDVHSFRDGYFPYQGGAVKDAFEALKTEFDPDVIFAPRREDEHQDHRLVAELTWNTFRDHLILEYEIPKYEGDLGSPNVFVGLPEETWRRKIDLLLQLFPSQSGRSWFTADTFRAVLRLRGVESNAASGYAEGFGARKLLVRV